MNLTLNALYKCREKCIAAYRRQMFANYVQDVNRIGSTV